MECVERLEFLLFVNGDFGFVDVLELKFVIYVGFI